MSWTPLRFGKHIEKTLPQVMFTDPDWFFWAYEEDAFKGYHKREAEWIHARATTIRIPQPTNSEEIVAEYMIHPSDGKFCGMDLIPKNRPVHQGSTRTFRRNVIDMSMPRQISNYDKLGCRLMIAAVKENVLGSGSTRMTKVKCENFFDDLSRFKKTGVL